ncbi:hypothetical protein Y032_0608g603 [Ancylostoma ceylanicum]|uniref:MMS19 nucleotide excision repair protein n=1 Tax=Ancylostoma ceylanicum TaxID=53326 RepID=A0A016WNH4_9BILA|nr:hypothetical protein Y032_0608g603 [Ancylostoma ceylanicum]
MSTTSGDSDLYQRLVVDRSLALSDYLELKKPLLFSQSDDVREATLSEIVDTVCSLPGDFLTREQVALLLDFLLGRLESSPVAASHAVRGIHHLVTNSQNHPEGFEKPLLQIMFIDGNVQGWDVEKRVLQYNVLEWLLLYRLQELKPLGSNFVLMFIKTMGGERHPRCLPMVFRMFVIVARSFPLGPLVEDLFEVIACYFPIEFKQASTDSPITKQLLAEGCMKCLVAHPDFAPFCYMLIEEKFTDDDCTPEQKEDTCELLAEAASVFPPEEIVDHLESMLGGVRIVGLNPKGSLPDCVPRALSAVTNALNSAGSEAVVKLGSQLIENLEPFVLQAEMGLTERALALLRCAAQAGPAIRSQIYDHVTPWILMLANRLEIVQEGLRALAEWTRSIQEHSCDDVLRQFESSLFASLDVARETAPNEALTALHSCAVVYLKSEPLSDDVLERSIDIVKRSWNALMEESVRSSYLCLVTTLAEVKWESLRDIISEKAITQRPQDSPMLCAAIHDELSYMDLSTTLRSIMADHPSRELFDYFLEMATRLTKKVEKMLPRILEQYVVVALKVKSPSEDVTGAYAETLQSLGLLLDEDTRLELVNKVMALTTSSQMLDMFCLFLIQSKDVSIMERCLKLTFCSERSAYLLCVGIANHSEDLEKLQTIRKEIKYNIECAVAKGLLLRGRQEGIEMIKELFGDLCRADEVGREKLCAQLCDLFDFDSAASDPRKCLFRTTFLWRQRIFNQLGASFVVAVSSANEAGRDVLMQLLPALLKSSENSPTVHQQFDEFLPVFRVALSNGNVIQPAVLTALPRFISGLPSDGVSPDDGQRIIKAVTRTLNAESTPMNIVLACLESLRLLAQRVNYNISETDIATVVGATTRALAHPKRIVRQKAAAIRNLWWVSILRYSILMFDNC